MISHSGKCIFVHIRKSAGSSIKQFFPDGDSRLHDGVLSPDWHKLADIDYPGYLRFAVIRNPWERFISGWKYCFSTKNQTVKEVLNNLPQKSLKGNVLCSAASENSRRCYLDALIDEAVGWAIYKSTSSEGDSSSNRKTNKMSRAPGHDYRHITIPQIDYLVGDGGVVVDRVLSLENIENEFRVVSDWCGIDLDGFPRVNASSKSEGCDYRDFFDAESRVLFYRAFKSDVDCLGYSFEGGPGVPPHSPLTGFKWLRLE